MSTISRMTTRVPTPMYTAILSAGVTFSLGACAARPRAPWPRRRALSASASLTATSRNAAAFVVASEPLAFLGGKRTGRSSSVDRGQRPTRSQNQRMANREVWVVPVVLGVLLFDRQTWRNRLQDAINRRCRNCGSRRDPGAVPLRDRTSTEPRKEPISSSGCRRTRMRG